MVKTTYCSCRTQVQFPTPIWLLTTISTFFSQHSGALVASKGIQYTYGTHNKHVGRTLIHKKIRLPPINVIVVF